MRTFRMVHMVRKSKFVESLFFVRGRTAASQVLKSETVTASGNLASAPASAMHDKTLHLETTLQSTTS